MNQLRAPLFARAARRASILALLVVLIQSFCVLPVALAQDLSWVKGAIERSKQQPRDNVPLWQFDPRVAAGSGDASLHAVACASPDRVWSVGDRGLILASQDGGRTWNPQFSGTTLNLYAIAMVDQQRGFAVGGTVQPLSRMSLGIVLATEDGGAHWRSASSETLPRMTGLTITDRGALRAWGDYSPAHSSAILESYDQGKSWQPVPSKLGHVQTVGRQSGGLQLAVDRAGRIAQVPARPEHPLGQLAPPTTFITALAHTGAQWLAVGDKGTVASSRDGTVWIDKQLPLSALARKSCDLRCIAQVDRHVWLGGSPGSVLLHSEDHGETWKVQPTDQNWPINAITFFDSYRGWAVTDAGTILATRDGGKTWFSQRQPLGRLGLQAFASLPGDVSWNALADATWQARQGAALTVVHRQAVEDAVDFAPDGPAMLAAAAAQTGLVSARQNAAYPLADRRVFSSASVAELYGRTNAADGRHASVDKLDVVTELTTQLRIGRPTVVLVDDNLTQESNLLADAVVRAMARAEHEQASDRWLSEELHLPAWQVSKLFTSSRTLKADFTINRDQILRDSGISISEVLASVEGFAAGSSDGEGASIPNMSEDPLRCLQAGRMAGAGRTALFQGPERHADSTRAVDLSNVGNLQLVMGRVHRDKAWQTLKSTPPAPTGDLESWQKKLEFIIEASPRHEVGPALVALAEANLRSGWWQRWFATLDRLCALAPQSDAARWGALEKLRYGASDERAAWELSRQAQDQAGGVAMHLANVSDSVLDGSRTWNSTPFENEQAASTIQDTSVVTASGVGAAPGRVNSEVITAGAEAGAETEAKTSLSEPARALRVTALQRAVRDFIETVERDQALSSRPDVQLANFARRRALAEIGGQPAPDASVLQMIATSAPFAGWQQVAEQEHILASGKSTLPAWTARARSTETPPRLDGAADDPCWQQATSVELTSPFHPHAPPSATTTQFAYDEEYLYVMLRCPLAPGPAPSHAPRGQRQYDMKLDGTDHLQLVLDTDRDYTSACELAVNQAGHTFDRCCQAREWNPQWYVAVKQDASAWSAELAIQLADLTTAQTVRGRAWAVSAFRYIPDWDVHSWSQLRSYHPRQQGSGLLLFDP